MAVASALRGMERFKRTLGSLSCLLPAIICAEMIPVGITTTVKRPGIGIGNTSGMEKASNEVPKEDEPPSESTIFCTVKLLSGFFSRSSRRIFDVRTGAAFAFTERRDEDRAVAFRAEVFLRGRAGALGKRRTLAGRAVAVIDVVQVGFAVIPVNRNSSLVTELSRDLLSLRLPDKGYNHDSIIMPRRDVVLTGLIAFGAGVAVGANWSKVRKKIGPLLEKLGLQIADLGDFLSANGMEDFMPEAMKMAKKAPRARRRPAAKATEASEEFFRPMPRRNGRHADVSAVRPSTKRKVRRKPVVRETEAPVATGTFGA